MDWLYRWSTAAPDLTPWEQRPFSANVEKGPRPRDNQDNHERVVMHEPPGPPREDARRLADAILRFDVFPPTMLTPVLRRTPIELGDTVGLRYRFVPGVDLFFASRVIDRLEDTKNNVWCCGFRYRTLEGHPECGEEDFVVEKDLVSGKVTVALRSWSRPGLWIATLAYPVIRRLQLQAGRAALDHLERLIHPDELPRVQGPSTTRSLLGRRDLRTSLLRSDERW